MKSTHIYTDVKIFTKTISSNASRSHTHNYFELIYIVKGKGKHIINKNHYDFSEGDLFLLTPEDTHNFTVFDTTTFCIIDFTESFFSENAKKKSDKADLSRFFKELEYVFHNHHNIHGNIVAENDKMMYEVLINQLLNEEDSDRQYKFIIVQNIVFLLLHFVARNIQENIIAHSKLKDPKNKIYEIITYIQQNIYEKNLIKLNALADNFNKSPDHLNRYFKRETGKTIKNYIIDYKIELIKTRLKHSNLSISEIADELNFTDGSHLNKIFKKAYGKTAYQYKDTIN
tara:strand:- start:1586 stop:2443 length:858 start_codon:yes stop_codon:yes gene_type:complete